MRAILINPREKTVTEIDYDGTLESLYKLLDCQRVQAIPIGNSNLAYIDEEGLLHNRKPFFEWKNAPQPIAGNALIVRTDEEGNDIAATVSVEAVAAVTLFPAIRYTGTDVTVEQGEGVTIIKSKANFEKLQ